MDVDEEVLLALAQTLGDMLPYVSGPLYVHHLLDVLYDIVSSVTDNSVRDTVCASEPFFDLCLIFSVVSALLCFVLCLLCMCKSLWQAAFCASCFVLSLLFLLDFVQCEFSSCRILCSFLRLSFFCFLLSLSLSLFSVL